MNNTLIVMSIILVEDILSLCIANKVHIVANLSKIYVLNRETLSMDYCDFESLCVVVSKIPELSKKMINYGA